MSGNAYYGAARESIMVDARQRVRELAAQGLSAGEIERRLDYRLTATESELLRDIVRHRKDLRRHRTTQALSSNQRISPGS